MPLAILCGIRYDSIELKSKINHRNSEEQLNKAVYVVNTGLIFSPSALDVSNAFYGTARIKLTATVALDQQEESDDELFSLEVQASLRYELDDASEIKRENISLYLADEKNIEYLTAQARPILNERVLRIVNESGLDMPISLASIGFKGRFYSASKT